MKIKVLLATSALLAGTSAWAQESPSKEQTSDDLVCQLSGDCVGVDEIAATKDMPESRGFKIARKTAANDPATPGKVVGSRPPRERIVPSRTTPAGTTAAPGRKAAVAKPKPAAIGRADLRVSFVTGSAELDSVGRKSAQTFVTALASPSLAGKKFRIEGHTDSVGTRESNLELSQRRAQAVVDYLVARGVDRSRFEVVGYGFDKPLTRDARDGVNRRVEVVVAK